MCTRFYDRTLSRLPGANGENTDNINEGRHACAGKPGTSACTDQPEVEGTDDNKGYSEFTGDIRIAFSIDDKSGRITIKVIDNLTGEVIRHVPPEDLMSVMSWLSEFQDILGGLVIDEMR